MPKRRKVPEIYNLKPKFRSMYKNYYACMDGYFHMQRIVTKLLLTVRSLSLSLCHIIMLLYV